MLNECQAKAPSIVQIKVTESKCDLMPQDNEVILEGPCINYEKSGPVCLTALNAIYPWIMVSRFDVETDILDYDSEQKCYHVTCPCGTVLFDIRKIKEKLK